MAVAADGVSAEAAAVGAAVESSVLGGLGRGPWARPWGGLDYSLYTNVNCGTFLPTALELCSKIILQSTCSDM